MEKIIQKLHTYSNFSKSLKTYTDEVEEYTKSLLMFDNLKSYELKFLSGPKSSNSDQILNNLISIYEDLNNLINYMKDKINTLVTLKVEIDEALNLLNENERLIIEYRYLQKMKWEQINDILHIDRRWCNELHKRAVKKIGKEISL